MKHTQLTTGKYLCMNTLFSSISRLYNRSRCFRPLVPEWNKKMGFGCMFVNVACYTAKLGFLEEVYFVHNLHGIYWSPLSTVVVLTKNSLSLCNVASCVIVMSVYTLLQQSVGSHDNINFVLNYRCALHGVLWLTFAYNCLMFCNPDDWA